MGRGHEGICVSLAAKKYERKVVEKRQLIRPRGTVSGMSIQLQPRYKQLLTRWSFWIKSKLSKVGGGTNAIAHGRREGEQAHAAGLHQQEAQCNTMSIDNR